MASETVPAQHEQPDVWHSHGAEEGLPQEEHGGKANAAKIFIVGVLSVGIIVATTVATLIYFRVHATALRRERIETTALSAEYTQYRQNTRQALADFSWASPDAARTGERVQIPLDQAKQRVIEAYSKARPAAPRAEAKPVGEGSGS